MTEVWKDIKGYEGLYQVSTFGRVKSLNYNRTSHQKILNPGFTKHYLFVSLCKNGKAKHYYIHRLVAEAFIPNPNGYPCVNHKSENKLDNRAENLEYCDAKYNNNYGTHNERISKILTNNKKISKKILCVETNRIYPSMREVQRQAGISDGNISECCNGKRKTAGGFHWTYANQ